MSWQFDGNTSRAFVPSGSWTYFDTAGWTISFWFKIFGTGTNAHQHWFFHRSGASLTDANTIGARINETNNIITSLYRSDTNNAWDCLYDPGVLNEWTSSGWTNLVMTMSRVIANTTTSDFTDDVRVGKLYVNGVLSESDNTHTNLDACNLGFIVFGKIGNASTQRTLSGALAEWPKWDRVLSADDISRLYRGHSPLHLNPTIYYPMRNDYVDRVIGLTGIGINNVAILTDHPDIGYKVYYPTETSIDLQGLTHRVGKLEEKGYIDFVTWAPGQITPTGCAQSGLFFSQAKVGEAYQVSANATLSGCLPTCHVDTSGFLTISVRNPGNTAVTVGATRWNVFRL